MNFLDLSFVVRLGFCCGFGWDLFEFFGFEFCFCGFGCDFFFFFLDLSFVIRFGFCCYGFDWDWVWIKLEQI